MFNNNNTEVIELRIPINSAYVSAIRVTASSITNRLKFNISEIEDIKSAVSECCTFLISKADNKIHKNFLIKFIIRPNKIDVLFSMPNMEAPVDISHYISLIMVKALVDDFHMENNDEGELIIFISKENKSTGF